MSITRSRSSVVAPGRPPPAPPAASGRGVHAARFGRFGEAAAARWYRRTGYRILDRNWRCREGEIDLVASRGSEVVIVEVKARTGDRYGTGAEAVDHRKRRRLRLLALRWLEEAGPGHVDLRFDVVEVDRRGHLRVHRDCF
jgi:putative endonuclease